MCTRTLWPMMSVLASLSFSEQLTSSGWASANGAPSVAVVVVDVDDGSVGS